MAVKDALSKAGSDYAHSVVLFLSGHFARHCQPAIAAASRAASCLQVTGCTVPGLFTEQAWAIDQPAAAAMVLCGPISLGLTQPDEPRLTLSTVSEADPQWVADGSRRFGTLATGSETQVEGQAWSHGKVASQGRVEIGLHGGTAHVGVSRGIRFLSTVEEVSDSDNFELFEIAGEPALNHLLQHLDSAMTQLEPLPLQLVFAVLTDPGLTETEAKAAGCYQLLPIMSINRDERSVSLASPLPRGSRICWAIREPASAEIDMENTLDKIANSIEKPPAFGLMFSCIGRGPYFYQGHDRDSSLVRERFPGMPLLGVYGAGEIAPMGLSSSIISHSSVLALVTAEENV